MTVHLKNGYQFGSNGRLFIMFGFGGKFGKITKTTESLYVSGLAAMSTFYVCCNIVRPQVVGDSNAMLLRKCSCPRNDG